MSDLDGVPTGQKQHRIRFQRTSAIDRSFQDQQEEIDSVSSWISQRAKEGVVAQNRNLCSIGRATFARTCSCRKIGNSLQSFG